MSDNECRHLPEPVWNPVICPKCGARVRTDELAFMYDPMLTGDLRQIRHEIRQIAGLSARLVESKLNILIAKIETEPSPATDDTPGANQTT